MLTVLFILILTSSSLAGRVIPFDQIEDIFGKYATEDLSPSETQVFYELVDVLHRPQFVSKLHPLSSTETSARTTVDCVICRSLFQVLFTGVQNGQTDEELYSVLTTLCTQMGIESYVVCKGAVSLNVPILTYIVRNTPKATPRTFCGLLLQTATNPNVCRIDDSRFEWHVHLPEKVEVAPVTYTDDRPLTIAFLTDAHIDPLYEVGSVANCGEPTCCRRGQVTSQGYYYKSSVDESVEENAILINKDGEISINLDGALGLREKKRSARSRHPVRQTVERAGYWGDYRCNTPTWTYDHIIETIAETRPDIDVIYYIGDSVDHGVWQTSYELINNTNRYIVDKIRNTFGDNVPVFPTIGNHDAQPTNQFAPPDVKVEKLNTTWLYNALAEKWDFYLSAAALDTLRERGDYAMVVRPGWKVISLNNNIAYRYNWWLVYDPSEAKKHLDWLITELHKSELAGEKVHIITHIPPGVHDLIFAWTREYNRIINRFSSTVAAEFNGHTHSDEFKIFYSEDGTPISVAWGGGSATTYTDYNQNFKIATFDTTSYEPITMINYVYNLTEANLRPDRRPHWFQLYDFKNSFNLPSLTAQALDDMLYRMVNTERTLLILYSAYYYKLGDNRLPLCDINCQLDNMCRAVVTVLWDRRKCEELRRIYYRKTGVSS